MLTLLAYSMIIVFMALIMTKRLSAMVALILVPIVFGLIAGFGLGLGPMMLDGIKKLAPTGVMLMFAILYFGVMIDAGLFDPAVRAILKVVGGDPMKIVVGTFVLAVFVSLDGDGSTTYMITCAAMLPLYKRLGISRLVLACVIMMAGGLMNVLPWGGPTAHAANIVPVVSLIFAAGIFVGILSGTKMVDAIAASVISAVPDWMGPYMAIVTAVLSVPFTFFISNDAFYFGILPILAKAAAVYGIGAVEIGRASLIGQQVHLLSPLVASTYLLVGLAEVEFGDHQRYTLLWALSAALVMLVATIAFGVIPIAGHAR